MELPSPSASSILPLIHPQESPTSVQWLGVSICVCLSQLLVGPLRGQLCQAPVCKHIIASVIVSGLGPPSLKMDPKLGQLLPFLQSLFNIWLCSLFDWKNSGSEILTVSSSSLVTLCFVQWVAVSIHFCICQALAKPLRRQLY